MTNSEIKTASLQELRKRRREIKREMNTHNQLLGVDIPWSVEHEDDEDSESAIIRLRSENSKILKMIHKRFNLNY